MTETVLPRLLLKRIAANDFETDDADILDALRRFHRTSPSLLEVMRLSEALARSSSPAAQEMGRSNGVPFEIARSDIASTGGPSSLSTLAAPMLVVLMGGAVFKMSERGSLAGAIDTLETLPGFVSQPPVEFVKELLVAGRPYVHIAQTQDFAPADKKLIAMRRNNGLMASADLAIASLLGKKINTPIRSFVLDVRVGRSGNVGSLARARRMARRFVEAALGFGLSVRCALTDLRTAPQSPYFGRGESLLGLFETMSLSGGRDHLETLISLAFEALDLLGCAQAASVKRLRDSFGDPDHVLSGVASLLQHQGVREENLRERFRELQAFEELRVLSLRGGLLRCIDLEALKKVITTLSRRLPSAVHEPFWRMGLRWTKDLGEVRAGDTLCRLRFFREFASVIRHEFKEIERSINECLTLGGPSLAREPSEGSVLTIIDERGRERRPLLTPLQVRALLEGG